jgi:hypothetical protein
MGIGLPRRVLKQALPRFQPQYPQIDLVLLSVDIEAIGQWCDHAEYRLRHAQLAGAF